MKNFRVVLPLSLAFYSLLSFPKCTDPYLFDEAGFVKLLKNGLSLEQKRINLKRQKVEKVREQFNEMLSLANSQNRKAYQLAQAELATFLDALNYDQVFGGMGPRIPVNLQGEMGKLTLIQNVTIVSKLNNVKTLKVQWFWDEYEIFKRLDESALAPVLVSFKEAILQHYPAETKRRLMVTGTSFFLELPCPKDEETILAIFASLNRVIEELKQ